MCDPISIAIALATTGGSMFLQNMAAKKVDKAHTGVVQRANKDLDKLRDEANSSYQKSIKTSTPEAISTQMQAKGADRSQAYQEAVTPSEMLPGQGDASKAVRQSIIQTLGAGDAGNKEQARRRGAYDAYGEADFGRDQEMKRRGQEIGQVGNFAQGRAGLVPLELEAASHAGDSYADMAGLVSGLGSVAGGLYGMSTAMPAGMAKEVITPGVGTQLGTAVTDPLNGMYRDFVKNSGLWENPSWMKARW